MSRQLITQFAKSVLDFSSQYGKEDGTSYAVGNLAGEAIIHPRYGDFTQACVFRTYGPWWQQCPSAVPAVGSVPEGYCSQDFVELLYEHPVYIKAVKIFETYNPGAVVRILAADGDPKESSDRAIHWSVLWQSESPQECPQEARIFSPPVKTPPHPSRLLRLELNSSLCRYYTELDAVLLEGEAANQSEQEELQERMSRLGVRDDNETCQELLSPIEQLPSELLQRIFSLLDLSTLARLAQVNRLFASHVESPTFLRELNLRPYCFRVSDTVLTSLGPRCANRLRELDLSWCGNHGLLTSVGLRRFLSVAGSRLTVLRMANCGLVGDDTLTSVAQLCPQLREMDLSSCRSLSPLGFRALTSLVHLERLNLYRTKIDLDSLVLVVQSCAAMRHLNLGSCCSITKWDELCKEVAVHCRGLVSLDLWRARSLSHVGLRALADNCPDLAELDLGWCSDLHSGSSCFEYLASKCTKLRKLFLTANRSVCDSDLAAVARYCPEMEQLDVLGTREISKEQAKQLLRKCKQLRMFDVSFCAAIDFATVRAWRSEFPHCAIQMSFQTALEMNTANHR